MMASFEKLKYKITHVNINEIAVETRFDREADTELEINTIAQDIKANGMHTEIWLRENSQQDGYLLISGNRRLEAHVLLGKKRIRAKIYSIEDKIDAAYMTCSENANRLEYDHFEKIQNFLYLLHLEFISVNPDASQDFIASRYMNAVEKPVLRLKINSDDPEPQTQAQKSFEKMINRVFEKSGMYNTYSTLYLAVKVGLASRELKQFCVENALSIKSIQELELAERKVGDEILLLQHDAQVNKSNKKHLDKIDALIASCVEDNIKSIEKNESFSEAIETLKKRSELIKAKIKSATLLKKQCEMFERAIAELTEAKEIKELQKLMTEITKELLKLKYVGSSIMMCILRDVSGLAEKSHSEIKKIIEHYKKLKNKDNDKTKNNVNVREDFIFTSDNVMSYLKDSAWSTSEKKKLERAILRFTKDVEKIQKQYLQKAQK